MADVYPLDPVDPPLGRSHPHFDRINPKTDVFNFYHETIYPNFVNEDPMSDCLDFWLETFSPNPALATPTSD